MQTLATTTGSLTCSQVTERSLDYLANFTFAGNPNPNTYQKRKNLSHMTFAYDIKSPLKKSRL